MSTHPSIDSKAEDAVKAAFIAIGGADWTDLVTAMGFTVNQGGDPDEMATPCVNIYCSGVAPREALFAGKLADHYSLDIVAEAITNAEDCTRTEHANLFGLLQAIGIQSADQMVAKLNDAGVSNFRASQWKHTGGANGYQGQTRVSSLTFSLICHRT